MKRGHVPIRMCIVCRTKRPANELLRLKAIADTVVVSDRKGQHPGRGCYICPTELCVDSVLKKRGLLQRALRLEFVSSPSKEALLKGFDKKG